MSRTGHRAIESPNTIVLGPADNISQEMEVHRWSAVVLPKCFQIERQRANTIPIWNAGEFNATHRIQGRSIMGALLGEGPSQLGDHLWETLTKGHRLPVVYTRASGLCLDLSSVNN